MTSHTVLLPTDGSDFSQTILSVIRAFLKPEETEIILFRVGDPPHGGSGAQAELVREDRSRGGLLERFSEPEISAAQHPIYGSQAIDAARANLTTELSTLERSLQGAGYQVSTEVQFGDPAAEIISAVAHKPIDLVAMTTHGRTGLGRVLMGSVAEEVIRHVSVPILLLRPSMAQIEVE